MRNRYLVRVIRGLSILKLFYGLAIAALWLFPCNGFAACSPYVGDMTINEVYRLGNEAWVEVRLLEPLDSSIYENWSLRLCAKNNNDGCHDYSLSSGEVLYPEIYPDWIRVNVNSADVNLQKNGGMDIVLRGQGGQAVDYLSVNDYHAQSTNCLSFKYPIATGQLHSSPKGIYRDPDGKGPWVELGRPGANGFLF